MRLPAKKDTRFAGDAIDRKDLYTMRQLYMTPGRPFDTQTFALDTHMLPQNVKDFAAAERKDKNDAIIAAALRVANQKQTAMRSVSPHWSDFEASPPSFNADRAASEIMAAAMRDNGLNSIGMTTPNTIELPAHLFPSAPLQSPPSSNERRWPARSELPTGTYTRDMMAREERREADRGREDFVGQGAFGTVFTDEPGLVRKEINTRAGNQTDKRIQQEIDDQLFLAEAGVGPRVHSFDTAVHGDPLVKSVVMQDLRDNYEPSLPAGAPAEHVDDWGLQGTQDKYRRFALAHQKQMGTLALKGMNLMDRHSGNVMRHKMTGRPMQLDAGIAMRVTGDQQVEALVDATVNGFKAAGHYDVAEIINDTAYDYLAGGQTRDAWDFTKEAFANLQKIKKPTNAAPF